MTKKQKTSNTKLLKIIVESIKEKKGKNIIQIDLSKLDNPLTDYFIICHGTSTTHVESIASNVEKQVKNQLLMKIKHVEGKNNAQWVLIDLHETIVHIFLEDARQRYNLEQLWADGKVTCIKDDAN